MATITAALQDGLQVELTAGKHTWIADEPASVGGEDTGPNPYEYLLGALAACTVMTIRMYCDRKGWQLADVRAEFSHDRIHVKDCEDCEADTKGYIDRITSNITIEGRFDDEQRARLHEIAVRCPVHKTLEKSVTFADNVAVT